MAEPNKAQPTVEQLVQRLEMLPHPEGGFYKETFRDAARVTVDGGGTRGASTAILYLLPAGAKSRLHRLDASECWHAYAGAAPGRSSRLRLGFVPTITTRQPTSRAPLLLHTLRQLLPLASFDRPHHQQTTMNHRRPHHDRRA
jgi:hypothetical protein